MTQDGRMNAEGPRRRRASDRRPGHRTCAARPSLLPATADNTPYVFLAPGCGTRIHALKAPTQWVSLLRHTPSGAVLPRPGCPVQGTSGTAVAHVPFRDPGEVATRRFQPVCAVATWWQQSAKRGGTRAAAVQRLGLDGPGPDTR